MKIPNGNDPVDIPEAMRCLEQALLLEGEDALAFVRDWAPGILAELIQWRDPESSERKAAREQEAKAMGDLCAKTFEEQEAERIRVLDMVFGCYPINSEGSK